MLNSTVSPKGRFAELSETKLGENSRFYENRRRDLEYLRLLDCDRILYNFRSAFGVSVKGAQPLGGWEAPDCLLRGHSAGHFISALSLAASATGEEIFTEKLKYMVGELRRLQLMCKGRPEDFKTLCVPGGAEEEKWNKNPEVWGEGFISAYSPDQFAALEKMVEYKEIWAPYYTLHKILAGMLECYERIGLREALTVAKGIGDWVHGRLSALTAEHRKKMWSLYIAGEYGGMNESLTRLYEICGDEKYLAAAKMFDNDNVFPGLAEGKDTIACKHANQHIPQIIGAEREYAATGEEYYKKISENFFDIVSKNHMYAIGGVGQAESFRESGALAANIKDDTNCETCAAYNLLKLARELYSFNPENAAYMDYYERALINQILASQSPVQTPARTSGVTYMLPIGPGAERKYSSDYEDFTCCHGTGMENHVKYQDASFFITDDALYINQYIAASMKNAAVDAAVNSDFPFGNVEISLEFKRDFTVKLRLPYWCKGNPFSDTRRLGSCAAAFGKAGEKLKIIGKFNYEPRLEYTPDTLDGSAVAALMYGPFVMVAEDPSKEWITLEKDIVNKLTAVEGAPVPTLTDGAREFVPMYWAGEKPYHAYFKVE